jgi:uncharacterized membrane protein/glutaredoxin
MIRRRNTPWIHKWSRPIIGAIAFLGVLNTGYLTYEKLSGGQAVCLAQVGAKGCDVVLSSPWASVFGQPLPIFGLLAYLAMLTSALAPLVWKSPENPQIRKQVEYWTWWFLLLGTIAMSVFSAYLMYVLAFNLQAVCFYCIGSALFSLSMLVLTIVGHDWEDLGQVFFTALIVGMVTIIGTLGIYSGVKINSGNSVESTDGKPVQIGAFIPEKQPNPDFGWEITTTSGESEIALAKHLVEVGAKEYVAYTCPHCHEQKLLFGKEAYKILEDKVKVECNPNSPKAKVDLCEAAKISSVPTWIINGQTYSGVQNLEELANATNYKGPLNFKYLR